eukprot:7532234-Pyramimonas_sp.AAC.1
MCIRDRFYFARVSPMRRACVGDASAIRCDLPTPSARTPCGMTRIDNNTHVFQEAEVSELKSPENIGSSVILKHPRTTCIPGSMGRFW